MTKTEDSLDAIRREIDSIDDRVHDLLMQRASLLDRLKAVKGTSSKGSVRPAREASILRRIAGRHAGPLPRNAVLRVWREVMSALTWMQDPSFSAAVYADEADPGYWDLARDMFGSTIPMTVHASARDVLAQVSDGKATFGILPTPTEQRPEPWWVLLCVADSPRIVFRLPFADPGNVRHGERGLPDALAVARIAPEPTGADRTALVIETNEMLSRTALGELFSRAGLKPLQLVSEPEGTTMHLAIVDGFVAADDPRLVQIAERDAVARALSIGSYPQPIAPVPSRGRGRSRTVAA
ncbi:MAG: chorismate mutase [Alphaproteobacteria bacterium]